MSTVRNFGINGNVYVGVASLKTDYGSASYPFFGRLRRKNYENVVKGLMGEPRQDPIMVPQCLMLILEIASGGVLQCDVRHRSIFFF